MSDDVCLHCGEAILPTESIVRMPVVSRAGTVVRRQHYECHMRQIVGGLNHLQGRCSCCGGTEPPDPPGMTKREAALAAVREWERQQ